ncbi:hypothetical protein DCCM_0496 [Desulfocucumis palustris]|uniref:Uncharacterized protein n=1 Tax=Desulfocucumis palustris TaxID=1898651 RepID=A0A2L2X8H5_9FIRM|nr:hypothetical protein DCCM_0496 [Desulfocucumis palustris]
MLVKTAIKLLEGGTLVALAIKRVHKRIDATVCNPKVIGILLKANIIAVTTKPAEKITPQRSFTRVKARLNAQTPTVSGIPCIKNNNVCCIFTPLKAV